MTITNLQTPPAIPRSCSRLENIRIEIATRDDTKKPPDVRQNLRKSGGIGYEQEDLPAPIAVDFQCINNLFRLNRQFVNPNPGGIGNRVGEGG